MESKIKYDSEEEEFTCKLVQDLLSSVIMKRDGWVGQRWERQEDDGDILQ